MVLFAEMFTHYMITDMDVEWNLTLCIVLKLGYTLE